MSRAAEVRLSQRGGDGAGERSDDEDVDEMRSFGSLAVENWWKYGTSSCCTFSQASWNDPSSTRPLYSAAHTCTEIVRNRHVGHCLSIV